MAENIKEKENEVACDAPQQTSSKQKKKVSSECEELKAKLALLEEKSKDELARESEKLMRMAAEYDNYRKRTIREKEMIYPEAIKTAAEAILPVLDTFERALTFDAPDEEYKKGFSMIYDSLAAALGKLGITEIDAKDKPFDPERHNAVMHIEDDTLPESTVCEVLAKGYMLGDLVVRHAMVKVAN